MSTGLTLWGFILSRNFFTCSNVGLMAALWAQHFLMSCIHYMSKWVDVLWRLTKQKSIFIPTNEQIKMYKVESSLRKSIQGKLCVVTHLTIIVLIGAVSVCFSCFQLRKLWTPHDIQLYKLFLLLWPKWLTGVTISFESVSALANSLMVGLIEVGHHTHRNKITAGCNLDQNDGIAAAGRDRRG